MCSQDSVLEAYLITTTTIQMEMDEKNKNPIRVGRSYVTPTKKTKNKTNLNHKQGQTEYLWW